VLGGRLRWLTAVVLWCVSPGDSLDQQPECKRHFEDEHREPQHPGEWGRPADGAGEDARALYQQEDYQQNRGDHAESRKPNGDHATAQKEPSEDRAADGEEDGRPVLAAGDCLNEPAAERQESEVRVFIAGERVERDAKNQSTERSDDAEDASGAFMAGQGETGDPGNDI